MPRDDQQKAMQLESLQNEMWVRFDCSLKDIERLAHERPKTFEDVCLTRSVLAFMAGMLHTRRHEAEQLEP